MALVHASAALGSAFWQSRRVYAKPSFVLSQILDRAGAAIVRTFDVGLEFKPERERRPPASFEPQHRGALDPTWIPQL